MGIPSYYRKLASTVNGLYCDAPTSLDWFLMDFNCLIYQVLRNMPTYVPSDRLNWEKELIRATCDYTAELLGMVGARNVFIALDGTVPLAKMKQQRMRRFRAIELAAEERRLGLREGFSWDSNAITPGTAFMDALGSELRSRFPEATISDVREAGEGEHKVMRHVRGLAAGTKCAVYGLDGDLFVLALLNQQLYVPDVQFFFFREEEDRRSGTTELVWLSLARLAGALAEGTADRRTWLTEYALAMCLLGNDFVPQSMAFRIKEDGHERLIKMLQRLHAGDNRLMAADGSMDQDAWMKLFAWLAKEEEWRIEKAIEKKKMARRTPVGETAKSAIQAKMNDRPLEWFAEADGQLWSEGTGLKGGWRTTYAVVGFGAVPGAEAYYHSAAAQRYLEAVEWTYKYYTSGITDWDWMYEFAAAPLFEQVVLASWPTGSSETAPPKPEEQLALVLPPASYWLLPACRERQFLVAAPEYFPKSWSYHHLGKRHFWECEAHIPLPTIRLLRQIIRSMNIK